MQDVKDGMKRLILRGIETVLQNIIDSGGDIFDSLVMRRGELIPPRKLRRMIGGITVARRGHLITPRQLRRMVGSITKARRYRAVGEMLLECFTNLCSLMPNEDVLDVGCGCGRQAAPLTKYLDKSSTYEGFDIVPPMIRWCRDNISSRYPNFHFRLADLSSKVFNPHGQCEASKYQFPYPNESFDFAFATSVFTHMLPPDMENYLSEIARTLRSGGRCLITFYLLSKESLELVDAKRSACDFKHDLGQYRSIDSDRPERFVCHDESLVFGLHEKYGLEIRRPIRYGTWSWCTKPQPHFLLGQDIVIASKR